MEYFGSYSIDVVLSYCFVHCRIIINCEDVVEYCDNNVSFSKQSLSFYNINDNTIGVINIIKQRGDFKCCGHISLVDSQVRASKMLFSFVYLLCG